MNAIQCPKCSSHARLYSAPLGFIVRNVESWRYSGQAVHDKCPACEGIGYLSTVIIDAITNAFPKSAEQALSEIQWSGDHYSFNLHGMYVGVERDGYIHT